MKSEAVKDLLQKFPLFKGLTDSEIEPIVDLAKNRTYRHRTHIFMQGDPLTNVYFIHQGKVKIYKTDFHGKEQIVNVLQTGDMFPHQGFFRQDDYPAHAEVIEDATLIYIPISSFESFLVNHPEICVKLFRVLGDIIVDLQARLEEKLLHNTYEQIIMLLIRLSKGYGKETSDGMTKLSTNFTNRELANMIGSSRETVSRTLTQLKKQHLLTTDKSGAIMLDIDALEEELF
ncbi:CRP/FNR family transcriptional regulator, anaerobic regulatory protein [Lentibacillus persicus]|uniref:CRP/FNR family transcriptional regulator, anaerobic regulatory protein n=1 Tax=Lentibacillus persicus TaxID=640948 RepID=A0A1I1RW82_9BACI|nr:Crp/Fnr family transcriptional regulator [Lentibacillus persicus]SFD38312.1 CRP/FNR family transcriptional regulator, anaerobic regulatory protein [Lentibacillus persicus]